MKGSEAVSTTPGGRLLRYFDTVGQDRRRATLSTPETDALREECRRQGQILANNLGSGVLTSPAGGDWRHLRGTWQISCSWFADVSDIPGVTLSRRAGFTVSIIGAQTQVEARGDGIGSVFVTAGVMTPEMLARVLGQMFWLQRG